MGHIMKRVFFSMDAHYGVMYVWLVVDFFVLKWSMRPRVRTCYADRV